MSRIEKPNNRAEWLKCRQNGIGGSDAGAVLGMNKYKSNLDLWREKTGQAESEDISEKAAVQFGKQAEQHIRELFKLEHSEFDVDYHEYWMYHNDKHDFMYATLDGELTDKLTGQKGILEIKTTTIQNTGQWNEWDNRIPDSYYVQILHQLACTGWDFAILKAYIKYINKEGQQQATVREYRFDRKDVVQDIEYVIDKELQFWERVVNLSEIPLILPKI